MQIEDSHALPLEDMLFWKHLCLKSMSQIELNYDFLSHRPSRHRLDNKVMSPTFDCSVSYDSNFSGYASYDPRNTIQLL